LQTVSKTKQTFVRPSQHLVLILTETKLDISDA